MKDATRSHDERRRTRRLVPVFLLSALLTVGTFPFISGLSQCGNTCTDVDNDPCSANSWQVPAGQTCDLSQRPSLPDGTLCGENGVPGICASGVCQPTPVLAAGSASTTWRAPVDASSDGCTWTQSQTQITFEFDTTLTLLVESDGAGNVKVGYDVLLDPGFGAWANSGLAALSVGTTLSGATPTDANNMAHPSIVGLPVLPYIEGTELPLGVSRATIAQAAFSVTPTSFQDVTFNWSQDDFYVELIIAQTGAPQFELDVSSCDFTIQGADISMPVGGCSTDADCDDGNACTLNFCNASTSRCFPAASQNEGADCDPGTGSTAHGECSQGICRIFICSVGGTPVNEGRSCRTTTGSQAGTCNAGECVSDDECLVDTDCEDDCNTAICDTSAAPYVCIKTPVADGTRCNGSIYDLCDAGVCVPAPIPAAGSGTSVFHATTTPPGGPEGATGGCEFIGVEPMDVGVTMFIDSDGAGNIDLSGEVTLESYLLPSRATSLIDLRKMTARATGGHNGTTANPFFFVQDNPSQPLGDFLTGNVAVIPISGPSPTISLAGALATSTEVSLTFSSFSISIPPDWLGSGACTFDVQGAPIVLPLVQP